MNCVERFNRLNDQLNNDLRLSLGEVYTISLSNHISKHENLHYQLPNDEKIVAYQLYDILRKADQSHANVIVIELPLNQIKWHAIRDKILKAGRPLSFITN